MYAGIAACVFPKFFPFIRATKGVETPRGPVKIFTEIIRVKTAGYKVAADR